MRDSLHNSLRSLRRIPTLKDPTAHKHPIAPQLHHERRICRCRHTPSRKVHHRQTPQLRRLLEQRVVDAELLGIRVQFRSAHRRRLLDVRVDLPHVAHRLDDVARAGLAFCADHRCALKDAAQGFAEVAAAADEGDAEGVLVDVVDGVGGREDFRLVNVVYAEGFEDLRAGGQLSVSRDSGR